MTKRPLARTLVRWMIGWLVRWQRPAPAIVAAMLFGATIAWPARAGTTPVGPIDATRSLYLLRCGGCHGIQGVSVPRSIPTLRGRAGVFLCSAKGRDFVLRLPNVQMALIRNDQALADVMNFVAFDLGGASAPATARHFTAADVALARHRPLPAAGLLARRDQLLREAGACAAAYDVQDRRYDGPY